MSSWRPSSGPSHAAARARTPDPGAQPGQGPGHLGRCLELHHLGLEHVDLRGLRGQIGPERRAQPLVERVELEEVEQLVDRLGVDRAAHQILGRHAQVDVADEHHHLGVAAGLRLVLDQVLAQLRGLVVHVGEDPVESPVGGDELGRRLLPHTGDPRQVVGGIAAQGGVGDVQRRRDAGPLQDAGLVVEGVVGYAALVVQHRDVGILDQLVAVAVAGHDEGVVPGVAGVGGQRGDDVVGLEAGLLHDGQTQDLDDLAHQPHLLAQDVGGGGAVGLVGGDRLVAERRLGTVERDHDAVRLVVAHQVDQHRGEPEHGVGHLPARRGQVGGQGEERPVGERVAVDEHDLHGHDHPGHEGFTGPAARARRR